MLRDRLHSIRIVSTGQILGMDGEERWVMMGEE